MPNRKNADIMIDQYGKEQIISDMKEIEDRFNMIDKSLACILDICGKRFSADCVNKVSSTIGWVVKARSRIYSYAVNDFRIDPKLLQPLNSAGLNSFSRQLTTAFESPSSLVRKIFDNLRENEYIFNYENEEYINIFRTEGGRYYCEINEQHYDVRPSDRNTDTSKPILSLQILDMIDDNINRSDFVEYVREATRCNEPDMYRIFMAVNNEINSYILHKE